MLSVLEIQTISFGENIMQTQILKQQFTQIEEDFPSLSENELEIVNGGDKGWGLGSTFGATLVGARQAAVMGGVAGSSAGPVGIAIGITGGAVVGGLAGAGIEKGGSAIHNSKGHWWSFL
jgi:hypothetical protein